MASAGQKNSMESDQTTNDDREPRIFRLGDWLVEPQRGQISCDERTVRIEPRAMEVLVYLSQRREEVVTREELERDVWRGALVGYDAVTSTIIKLRKAFQDSAKNPRYIVTVPKRGYQLIAPVTDQTEQGLRSRDSSTSTSESSRRGVGSVARWLMGLMVVLGLVIATVVLVNQGSRDPSGSTPREVPKRQAIAVLPFENRGDDPKQEYFADGITEDIITDLSRLSNLLVISSNTSFTYKGRLVQPQAVGSELKVDFVLEGSIRRAGEAIRVNARLVDASTGFQRWAERYDKRVAEVFSLQGEITNSIVEALSVELTSQEKQLLVKRATNNLEAYERFQQGQRLSKVNTKESNQQARAAYRRAIELDPSYGRAYGALAFTLAIDFRRGWSDSPIETLNRALELAKQAVALDDSIPQTHWVLGYIYLMRQEHENARKSVAQAINIAPNYADGYGLLALINNNLGQAEISIDLITKGMRLNPYYTWDYPYNLGRAYYTLGRYEEAIEALVKARERNENALPIRLFLATSYVGAGRLDDAEWEAEEIQMLNPTETVTHTEKTIPILNTEIKKSFLQDLRKAGLPE